MVTRMTHSMSHVEPISFNAAYRCPPKADGDYVGLEVDLRHHLEQRDVVLVAELVKVDVCDHPRYPPAILKSSCYSN